MKNRLTKIFPTAGGENLFWSDFLFDVEKDKVKMYKNLHFDFPCSGEKILTVKKDVFN
jgi:hypothetical protein